MAHLSDASIKKILQKTPEAVLVVRCLGEVVDGRRAQVVAAHLGITLREVNADPATAARLLGVAHPERARELAERYFPEETPEGIDRLLGLKVPRRSALHKAKGRERARLQRNRGRIAEGNPEATGEPVYGSGVELVEHWANALLTEGGRERLRERSAS